MGKRYGLIADIHSNLEGLTAALEALGKEGVDEIVCLGDIVGYNASPSECMDMSFEACSWIIKGNHDRYLLGEVPDKVREGVAHAAEWGRDQMSEEQIEKLGSLSDSEVVDDIFLIVHGSPRDRDEYLLSGEAVKGSLDVMYDKYRGLDICFFGHSHIPFLIGGGKGFSDLKSPRTTIDLKKLTVYLINPGSCGQPRDGCPLVGCAVFDSNDWTMTFLRVEYDIPATQDKVMEAGLEASFWYRLEAGR